MHYLSSDNRNSITYENHLVPYSEASKVSTFDSKSVGLLSLCPPGYIPIIEPYFNNLICEVPIVRI